MVGKLMKHELYALFRALLYLGAIVLVLAILTRIGVALNSDQFTAITAVLFVIAAIVMLFFALIVSVQRFWSSMFTGEGYMTFSLPATPTQILVAKLLSALIAMFFGALVTLVAVLITASGLPASFWEGLTETFGEIFEYIGAYISSDPLVVVEAVLYVVSELPLMILFFYCIMSVGQLLTKGRKGLTFVIFLAVYWGLSLLDVLVYSPLLENIFMNAGIHAYLWTEIAVNFVLDVAMFFFVRFILLHKVNLIV